MVQPHITHLWYICTDHSVIIILVHKCICMCINHISCSYMYVAHVRMQALCGHVINVIGPCWNDAISITKTILLPHRGQYMQHIAALWSVATWYVQQVCRMSRLYTISIHQYTYVHVGECPCLRSLLRLTTRSTALNGWTSTAKYIHIFWPGITAPRIRLCTWKS